MSDPTEQARRELVEAINVEPGSREALEAKHGKVWDFEATSFMAPWIFVKRKSDGKAGSLMFQHRPRFYFDFTFPE